MSAEAEKAGFDSLRGRSVGIFGMGIEGRAVERRLHLLGIEPTLVDDRPSHAGVLRTSEGGLDALCNCDVVIKSPGISRYGDAIRRLQNANVEIVGGLGLWLAGHGSEGVVGITGTKGKSTTTTIIGHLAGKLGRRPFIGGNIGTPPFAVDVDEVDPDLWAIEISSFQATDLRNGPEVVVLTSIHEDHIDWHRTVDQYQKDKLSICLLNGVKTIVANGSDDYLRSATARMGIHPVWINDNGEKWVDHLLIDGDHNRMNALLASAALSALGIKGADDGEQLAEAARGFVPLPSRFRSIQTIDGVIFIDDSASVNAISVAAALKNLNGKPLALLIGGFDRQIEYSPFLSALGSHTTALHVIVLPGDGQRVAELVGAVGVSVEKSLTMDSAVRGAFEWALSNGPNGVVLLSPGAPSFDLYANFGERASDFARSVNNLTTPPN
jgi:UDP-N-acetylmuramoyl-L-alanine---L-glutamate ligase